MVVRNIECIDKHKITGLICAYNEANNLPFVLNRIPDWVDEVLLIDGHSTDETVQIAKNIRPDIMIVQQPKTGKDDALKYGMGLVTGDIIVMLDADGATDPTEMDKFIKPLFEGYDFVKGSRFLNTRPQKLPWYRHFGNWVLVTETNLLFRTKFTDVCSGYNAFWNTAWKEIDFPDDFGYEPLIILRAKRAGLRIIEVSHHDNGRISGKSKLPNWGQGWGAFKAIWKERFFG